jgi:hypothetical protein
LPPLPQSQYASPLKYIETKGIFKLLGWRGNRRLNKQPNEFQALIIKQLKVFYSNKLKKFKEKNG